MYHVSGLYWRREHGKPLSDSVQAPGAIFSPCAAAALYHRASVVDAGGFNEDYFCYSEDIDLGFRLRARGYRAWHVPSAVVQHAGSGITGKHSDFSLYHGHRNLVWTYVRNMPGAYLWLYLPQHVLMNLFTLVYFALKGRGRVMLRAKRDALARLPGVWRERREIEAHRTCPSRALVSSMRKGWLVPYLRRYA